MSFSFTIPGVIKGVNHGYRVVEFGRRCPACGRGRPGISKVGDVETWQIEVAYRARQARPSKWVPGRRVRISYSVFFARAGRDADGILKFLLDGIAAGLEVNDSIFLSTAIASEVDRVNPRVEVTITNE